MRQPVNCFTFSLISVFVIWQKKFQGFLLHVSFKKLLCGVQEFSLIDKKELAPLQELIESIFVPY